jgi:hypothetical protein
LPEIRRGARRPSGRQRVWPVGDSPRRTALDAVGSACGR